MITKKRKLIITSVVSIVSVVLVFILFIVCIYFNFNYIPHKNTNRALSLGGWDIDISNLRLKSFYRARRAFEEATNGLDGKSYVPIALLGTAQCRGNGYVFLCRDDTDSQEKKSEFILVNVYDDSQHLSKVIGTYSLFGMKRNAGGWIFEQSESSHSVLKGLRSILNMDLMKHSGIYEPLVFARKDSNQGSSFSVLCLNMPRSIDEEPNYVIIKMLKVKNGNYKVLEVKKINFDIVFSD